MSGSFCNWTFVQLSNCPFVRIREVVGGGQGGPIICDFAPIHYLLTDKIPIYCLPLQYQFSDYLPDSDKWTIGQLDKCPITKRTALSSHSVVWLYLKTQATWFFATKSPLNSPDCSFFSTRR